jgi:type II secretory pathway component PulC
MRIGLVYKYLSRYSLYLLFILASTHLLASNTYNLPDGEVLQDPTKPQLWNAPAQVIRQQQKEPSFKLNYIVTSGQEKRAMINNQKVIVGDVISGATVKRINSDSVYLLYEGKQQELRMNKVKGIQRN